MRRGKVDCADLVYIASQPQPATPARGMGFTVLRCVVLSHGAYNGNKDLLLLFVLLFAVAPNSVSNIFVQLNLCCLVVCLLLPARLIYAHLLAQPQKRGTTPPQVPGNDQPTYIKVRNSNTTAHTKPQTSCLVTKTDDAMPPPELTHAPSLACLAISPAAFAAQHPSVTHHMTSVLVFRTYQSNLQVLLVRRAASDCYPLHWELPGGSVDAEDATILAAAARELREETGLEATHFSAVALMSEAPDLTGPEGEDLARSFSVDPADRDSEDALGLDGLGLVFGEPPDRVWGKVTLVADVRTTEEDVVLQEEEHDRWAWVSEEEARNARFNGSGERLPFVAVGVMRTVIEGFRVKKELIEKGE